MEDNTSIFDRYKSKVLGVRNYNHDKDEFYIDDFLDKDKLYEFLCEMADGESDITPAGVAFVQEKFDLAKLGEEYMREGKNLPPWGDGKTEDDKINNFIYFMEHIEPMEISLMIALKKWQNEGLVGDEPKLENLDSKFLPPN